MTLSRRLSVLVLLLGLVTTFAPSSRAQMAEIKAGVVKILVTAPAAKTGAGIIVRRDAEEAWIVTAAHVVSGADKIVVQFAGVASSWPAEVRNIETENLAQGLALLRVAGPLPAEVRALPLAIEVGTAGGEQVNMIGHQPSTGDWGVLSGIVSGRKGREVVIQAPIQEQGSGGPVILAGRVVGLVQRKDPTGAFGYAVTAQAIREYVEGLQIVLAPVPTTAPRAGGAAPSPVIARTLNVVTAGDQNMVDYVNNYLAPKFEKMNPGVTVRAVGTGPGDAGSQKIYEKLSAQQKAGSAAWDTDVAVVHQRGAATMVKENLLMPYRNDIAAGKLVSRDTAKNAMGANVEGYVMPMFHSQIAFAYNPDLVKAPPKSYAELAEWVKKNPKQFGYNGVKGGMSGVGFVIGWVGANSGIGDKLEKGPYDPAQKAVIDKSLASLKEFNQYVVMTPGNAGTLDMLNRGEITMGPVWVDMFYTWQADGRMSPKVKLTLPSPGLPGQPMYYVIPANAANAALAKKFVDFAESPEVQADGIVKQFNWYPGIDPKHVQAKLEPAAWNKLFTDISPSDLSRYGRQFPLSEYFIDIVEGYERLVLK